MIITSDRIQELIAKAKRIWPDDKHMRYEIAIAQWVEPPFMDVYPDAVIFVADRGTSRLVWRLDGGLDG